MRRLCLFCLVLLPFAGCSESKSPSDPGPFGRISFTTVAATRSPGVAGPQLQTVVRDPATWSRVWSELWGGRPPALPAIDFSREMVLVVTGSEICFGGARIEEVRQAGEALVVRRTDAAPSSCLCAQPELAFHVVRLARVAGDPTFEVRVTPPLCPT